MGLALSGGKADRACLAILEYYPTQKKIFLSRLIDRIKAEELISADLKITEIVAQYQNHAENIVFDVPLTLPKCFDCELRCPGYEICNEPEMKYMRHLHEQDTEKKKPKKMFTPYTQRCVEAYWTLEEEEKLDIQHAMGANLAPLVARARFINRRLKIPATETLPRLAVWRLGNQLKLNKSQLRSYRNSVGGEEARSVVLSAMAEKLGIFLYQQDVKIMCHDYHAFEAFICAYTGLLKYLGKTEPRPEGFPKHEKWAEVPEE